MRFLLLSLSCVALGGCDSFFEARGRVLRCDDEVPISGAIVRATLIAGVGERPLTVVADDQGQFTLALNEPPTARVSIRVEGIGYQPVTREISATRDGTRLTVCLSPVAVAPSTRPQTTP